jgi:hypothetical protein
MPRGKKNAIEQLINDRYANGVEISVSALAEEVGCTVQNVYIYIRKNPTRFTKVRRGLFKINPHLSSANGSSSSLTDSDDNFYDSKTMEA